MAVESITLNLIPTGDIPTIHVAQFDNERLFNIILKEGEDDFTPTGYGIEIQVRKVDNNIVTAQPVDVVGNIVTISTTEQMTACSGTNICELELTKDDISVATLRFYLVVQRDVLAGGLTSQSEIYNLEGQIAAIVPEVIGDEYYTAEQVDELIADIPTFDPSNYYDKTQLYTKTETNGLLSQKANTSALSTVAFTGSYNNLIDKPTIPDVSDYYTKAETYSQDEVNTLLGAKADTSSLSTVATTGDYDDLLNKPTIPAAQVQSDWSQADNTQVDYIKNKPTIPGYATDLPISSGDSTDTKTYVDNIADYSTSEKAVGKWIDGKTVYQKVIPVNSTVTNVWYDVETINGITRIISAEFLITEGGNRTNGIRQGLFAEISTLTPYKVQIFNNTSYSIQVDYLILKYIKS